MSSLTVNAKIKDRFEWVWHDIWEHYSNVIDPKTGQNFTLNTIQQAVPGIFRTGGCKSEFRKERGGEKPSLHCWATAFDIDPAYNPHSSQDKVKYRKPYPRLSHKEYGPLWEIIYHYGFYSFGIERDNDWMHVQTAHW